MDLTAKARAAAFWLKKGNEHRSAAILGEQVEKSKLKEWIDKNWADRWAEDDKNVWTHKLFPSLESRRSMEVYPNTVLVHFISGHGPYNRTLHKVGKALSPACPCGAPEETAEHIGTSCPRWRHLFTATSVPQLQEALTNNLQAKMLKHNLKELERLLEESRKTNDPPPDNNPPQTDPRTNPPISDRILRSGGTPNLIAPTVNIVEPTFNHRRFLWTTRGKT